MKTSMGVLKKVFAGGFFALSLQAAIGSVCGYSAPADIQVRPNKTIRLGAYFYAGKLDIEWYAKNFDLLDLNAKNDPRTISKLKRLNPDIKIYQQFLTNQLAIKQTGAQAVEGYEPGAMNEWLLRSTNGLVARSHRGPFYLMMDIAGTQGWAMHFSQYVGKVLQQTGGDGIVLDEVPLSDDVPFNNLIAYPNTAALQNGTKLFLRKVRSELGSPVLINAGQLHKKRNDGTSLWEWLGEDIDGAWHEGWVRFYGAHDYPHADEAWEWDIRSAETFSSQGKPYIASAAFRNAEELEYGVSNYLLAVNSKSLVFQPMLEYKPDTRGGFNAELVKLAIEANSDLLNVELGCALGKREFRHGIWMREFERGWALVNPTKQAVQFKRLAGEYKDVFGKNVHFPIHLSAFSGRIILKQKIHK